MEGRLPETILKGGAGSGVLRPRLVTAGSGGPGHRPPGMMTWLRGASLHGSGGNAGDGSAAPGRKSPRWSAERRASRVMGRAAPHSRGPVASRKRDKRNSAPVGAPPTPLRVGREWIETKPGRRNASRERDVLRGTRPRSGLFDIVKKDGARAMPRAAFAFARARSHISGSRALRHRRPSASDGQAAGGLERNRLGRNHGFAPGIFLVAWSHRKPASFEIMLRPGRRR